MLTTVHLVLVILASVGASVATHLVMTYLTTPRRIDPAELERAGYHKTPF